MSFDDFGDHYNLLRQFTSAFASMLSIIMSSDHFDFSPLLGFVPRINFGLNSYPVHGGRNCLTTAGGPLLAGTQGPRVHLFHHPGPVKPAQIIEVLHESSVLATIL